MTQPKTPQACRRCARFLSKPLVALAACLATLASGCALLFDFNPTYSDEDEMRSDANAGGAGSNPSSSGITGGSGGTGGGTVPTGGAVPADPIANDYPGDVGIESNPSVIFFEDFEQGSLEEFKAEWSGPSPFIGEVRRLGDMTWGGGLPSTAPADSRSLKMGTYTGPEEQGSVGLYRQLPTQSGTVYARYYIRHGDSAYEARPRIALGGYATPQSVMEPPSESAPTGTDFFFASFGSQDGSATMDHGVAWEEMIWPLSETTGNSFLGTDAPPILEHEAKCIELMLKLNTPGERDGELALWIDDQLVQEIRTGAPSFTPVDDGWQPDPTGGEPFAGFNWRATDELQLNWLALWREDPAASPAKWVYFDQVVIATERIGCTSP